MSQRNTVRNSQRDEDGSGQFERFEDLTRRLLAVPKKEVDKQRDKRNGKKNRK